jgi:hypothetical protein
VKEEEIEYGASVPFLKSNKVKEEIETEKV